MLTRSECLRVNLLSKGRSVPFDLCLVFSLERNFTFSTHIDVSTIQFCPRGLSVTCVYIYRYTGESGIITPFVPLAELLPSRTQLIGSLQMHVISFFMFFVFILLQHKSLGLIAAVLCESSRSQVLLKVILKSLLITMVTH